jgi:hypothetical protein
MHGDERYMRLSPVLPSGQSLWVYLLTGPHTGPIPGVFVAGRAAMAEALNWGSEDFAKAFAEVLREGLAEFDERTRLCFIPNAIYHNIPANPNVVKSWRAALLQLPECDMRGRIFEHLTSALSEVSEAFSKAFRESCGKAFENASLKDSGKQEQEQEQEQEVHPSGVAAAAALPVPSALRESAPKGRKVAGAFPVAKPDDVVEQVWADWCSLRRSKRAPITDTVMAGARTEAGKASMSLEQFLRTWCVRGSQGLQAEWLKPSERAAARNAGFAAKDYAKGVNSDGSFA